MLSAADTSQAPSPRQFHPWLNQYLPPRWRRLNTCRASESYQPRRTNQPIIITTIQGAVQVTISTANVEMLCTTLKANLPTKMNAMAMTPMNTVAWTRLKRGNTLEKSKPVPYSAVVPVDMPPISAMRHTGAKYQPG